MSPKRGLGYQCSACFDNRKPKDFRWQDYKRLFLGLFPHPIIANITPATDILLLKIFICPTAHSSTAKHHCHLKLSTSLCAAYLVTHVRATFLDLVCARWGPPLKERENI